MDETRLLELLNRINVWWDGEPVPETLQKESYRRSDFYVVRKKLDAQRRILTIRGPRQVGKTTLCGQLVKSLLDQGIPRERILYLSTENNQILAEPNDIITDSLEVYEQYVLRNSFRNIDDDIYVFIDEVQKVDDWASKLKYYADTYSNLRFVTTGSVSTLIKTEASETLIGRLIEHIMMPMKYRDYVDYHDILDGDTNDESTELRSSLDQSLKRDDTGPFTVALTRFYGTNDDARPRLDALKDERLLKGGYPGVLDKKPVDAYATLDSDLRYTVIGDLATVFNVQSPENVLRILSLITDSTTGKLNVQNIADTIGINRDTVERYLDYLEKFFLITECPRYTTSEYDSGGRPKMYMQDVGYYNTLAGTLSTETLRDGDKMGPILETAVCDHARRLQFYLSNAQNADITYWDKRGEVDFVLSGPDYVLPIEVKNGDSTQKDLRGLRNFLEESDAEFGLAVNDAEQLKEHDGVIHIPAWLFFFLC
jgi:predicted AAA+ superfamily ATPase